MVIRLSASADCSPASSSSSLACSSVPPPDFLTSGAAVSGGGAAISPPSSATDSVSAAAAAPSRCCGAASLHAVQAHQHPARAQQYCKGCQRVLHQLSQTGRACAVYAVRMSVPIADLTLDCDMMLVIAPWSRLPTDAVLHARFLDHVHICVHASRTRIPASLALFAHSILSDLQAGVTVRPRLGRDTALAARSGVPATKHLCEASILLQLLEARRRLIS